MPVNDTRVIGVILRGRNMMPAMGTTLSDQELARPDGLPAHFMTEPTRAKLPLPGMAAISLWMLALSVMGVAGVLSRPLSVGRGQNCHPHSRHFFAVAGLGLIRMRRWGWALTLGAVFLSMCFGCYSLFRFHQAQWVVMAVDQSGVLSLPGARRGYRAPPLAGSDPLQ